MATKVTHNSGNNEWYTPPYIIEAARATMGSIDLDPASCEVANRTTKADRYFTKEQNGLEQKWTGNVWLNPPYQRGLMDKFADKVIKEYQHYKQAIVLVNNCTETKWAQKLLEHCDAVCFPKGRVKYLNSEGEQVKKSPIQGQMILYFSAFGLEIEDFICNFEQIGRVLING